MGSLSGCQKSVTKPIEKIFFLQIFQKGLKISLFFLWKNKHFVFYKIWLKLPSYSRGGVTLPRWNTILFLHLRSFSNKMIVSDPLSNASTHLFQNQVIIIVLLTIILKWKCDRIGFFIYICLGGVARDTSNGQMSVFVYFVDISGYWPSTRCGVYCVVSVGSKTPRPHFSDTNRYRITLKNIINLAM